MTDLDDFDVAILRCLQVDNRQTTEVIGSEVGLSPTACQRRIKRLRASGVIASEVAILDPDRIGGRLTLIVQVLLARGRADIIDSFKREIRDIPEVQQCYYVTGEHDFILVITAEDMASYEKLTRRIFFANPNIQKFQTIVAMESVKLGLQIPF